MAITNDGFFFHELAALSGACAEGAKQLLRGARGDHPASACGEQIAALHADARQRDRKLREALVETWLLPIDRDDLRELSAGLVRIVEAEEAIADALVSTKRDPTLVEVVDLLARGCAAVDRSTRLVAELRKNRDALEAARADELQTVEAARRTLAGATGRALDPDALLDAVALRNLLERSRRAIDALHRHALLIESLLLEYA